MDTTGISSNLMKLLEGIGMNEPVQKVLPIIDTLKKDISVICERANELEFMKAHRRREHTDSLESGVLEDADMRLQRLVDDVHAKFKLIVNSH